MTLHSLFVYIKTYVNEIVFFVRLHKGLCKCYCGNIILCINSIIYFTHIIYIYFSTYKFH